MAVSYHFHLTDGATPTLHRLALAMQPRELGNAAAPAVRNLFQAHFRLLNSERANKLGGKRTNFYAAAARSTNTRVDNDGVVVSVNHLGIRQRFYGGPIRPTGGRQFLTLPAVPDAYGKRAREYNDLEFGFAYDSHTGRMRPALVETHKSSIRFGRRRQDGSRSVSAKERAGGRAVFWLVRKVVQAPDRSVIPSDEEIRESAFSGINRFLALQVKRQGGPR